MSSPYMYIPSGKRLHNYGKSLFLMAKSTNFLWPCRPRCPLQGFKVVSVMRDDVKPDLGAVRFRKIAFANGWGKHT